MAIAVSAVSPTVSAKVAHGKSFSLVAADVLKIQKNGVDDADLTYTVPAGKVATVIITFIGDEV